MVTNTDTMCDLLWKAFTILWAAVATLLKKLHEKKM
jgi:hypothetical protein